MDLNVILRTEFSATEEPNADMLKKWRLKNGKTCLVKQAWYTRP